MKMPPEFRGHRFFNFRRIFSNHFAFIRSFTDLLGSLTLSLVSFTLLLVNFALLLVSFVLLLVSSADLLVSSTHYDNERNLFLKTLITKAVLFLNLLFSCQLHLWALFFSFLLCE
jgi:hypothetical protein